MGIFTDNIQAFNRGFVSERAEKKALQKKKNAYKNFLYIKFYNQFYKYKKKNPENVFAYFQQPEVVQDIVCTKKFEDLEGFIKIELYHAILIKVYKNFKNNYKMNIDTSKQEEEEEKERQKLLKEIDRKKTIIKKQEMQIEKIRYQQYRQSLKCNNEIIKGFGKIGLGLLIGGRVASKIYKKMKY